MAVPVKELFKDKYFEGFLSNEEYDYDKIIHEKYEFVKRGPAETNFEMKQPIAYCILVNPELKKVYFYQRGSGENYNEKRLAGKISIGVGGHIEKQDVEDPLLGSAVREVKEEVEYNGNLSEPKILGYINDDSEEVGKVHFGIAYIFETDSTVIKPKDVEMFDGELINVGEFEKKLNDSNLVIEGWTTILGPKIIDYVKNLK